MNDTIKGADERELFMLHAKSEGLDVELGTETTFVSTETGDQWAGWLARASLGAAQVPAPTKDDEIAAEVVQRVCDYDDRNSPEDYPEMLMITGEELRDEVLRALAESREPTAGAAQVPSLSDAEVSRLTTIAFAATNESEDLPMRQYWFAKGLRQGAALSQQGDAK